MSNKFAWKPPPPQPCTVSFKLHSHEVALLSIPELPVRFILQAYSGGRDLVLSSSASLFWLLPPICCSLAVTPGMGEKSEVSFWTHLLPNLLTFSFLSPNLHFSSLLSYRLTSGSGHFSKFSQLWKSHPSSTLPSPVPWPFIAIPPTLIPLSFRLENRGGLALCTLSFLGNLWPFLGGSGGLMIMAWAHQGGGSELLRRGRRGHHRWFGGKYPPNWKFRQTSEGKGMVAVVTLCSEQNVSLGYLR